MEQNYYKINEDGKGELYFDYATFKALSEADRKEIKSYFLWSRNKSAWVSKSKDAWRTEQIAKRLGLEFKGKDKKLSFTEELEKKESRAEHNIGKFEKKTEKSLSKAEQLQSEFNRLRKDWSWLTQPIISGHKGSQAFGRSKARVLANYERGFEEQNKALYYQTKKKLAEDVINKPELKDIKFIQNRIKDAKTRLKEIDRVVEKFNNSLKREDITDEQREKIETRLEEYANEITYNSEKLAYYKLAESNLLENNQSGEIKVFTREMMKDLAVYIKQYFNKEHGLKVSVNTSNSFISVMHRPKIPNKIRLSIALFVYPTEKERLLSFGENVTIGNINETYVSLSPKWWYNYLKTQDYIFGEKETKEEEKTETINEKLNDNNMTIMIREPQKVTEEKKYNSIPESIKKFMPLHQQKTVNANIIEFQDALSNLEKLISELPKTYGTEGQGNKAIAYLHYFGGSQDWWITEQDSEEEQIQAFGLVNLFGDFEQGYVNIKEIKSFNQVELDFYWKPRSIEEIKGVDKVEEIEDIGRDNYIPLTVDNIQDNAIIINHVNPEWGTFRVLNRYDKYIWEIRGNSGDTTLYKSDFNLWEIRKDTAKEIDSEPISPSFLVGDEVIVNLGYKTVAGTVVEYDYEGAKYITIKHDNFAGESFRTDQVSKVIKNIKDADTVVSDINSVDIVALFEELKSLIETSLIEYKNGEKSMKKYIVTPIHGNVLRIIKEVLPTYPDAMYYLLQINLKLDKKHRMYYMQEDFDNLLVEEALKINGKNIIEFIPESDFKGITEKKIKINGEIDDNLKKITDLFIGVDDLRPIFTGVNFDDRGISVTNAHILLHIKTKHEGVENGTYKIGVEGYKKEIDGKYPNIMAVVPNYDSHVEVNVNTLRSYLELCDKYALESFTDTLYFKLGEVDFGFNNKLLTDCVKAYQLLNVEENVIICYSEYNTAIVLLNPNDLSEFRRNKENVGFILTMPVLIKGNIYLQYNMNTECVEYSNAEPFCIEPKTFHFNKQKKELQKKIEEVNQFKQKLEEEKAEKERIEAERIASEKAEADRLESERLTKLEEEKLKAEQVVKDAESLSLYLELLKEMKADSKDDSEKAELSDLIDLIQEMNSHVEELVETIEEKVIENKFIIDTELSGKLKVGTVLYRSWGYEQTNIDFYRVTKVLGKMFFECEELKQERNYTSDMSGNTMPIDEAKEKKIKGSIKMKSFGENIKVGGQYAYRWDGSPMSFSTYA